MNKPISTSSQRDTASQALDLLKRARAATQAGVVLSPADKQDLDTLFSQLGRERFASPGHELTAANLSLTLGDGSTAKGTDPLFSVDGAPLSYGDVLTFAGDFFGGTSLSSIMQPIATAGSTTAQQKAFNDKLASLQQATASTITLLQSAVAEQTALVQAGKASFGSSGSWQAYELPYDGDGIAGLLADIGGMSMAEAFEYLIFPNAQPSYWLLAAYNTDHFGEYAQTAYTVGHGLAITQAIQAQGDPAGLLLAYMMNAFADHFLTDLFSTGHLRPPRVELVQDFGIVDGGFFTKAMHDEDSLLGLTVVSKDGSATWTGYGDQRGYDEVNSDNMARAQAAVQQSATEIYQAFSTGQAPSTYEALEQAPDPAGTMALVGNTAPLFQVEAGGQLFMRNPVSSPASPLIVPIGPDDDSSIKTLLDAYTPFQLNFSSPVTLPSSASEYGGPTVAAFDGKVFAAWCVTNTGVGHDTKVNIASWDGSSWTNPTEIPYPGTQDNPPSLAVLNDQLYVAWTGYGDQGIWYTWSPDGTTWTNGQYELTSRQSTYGGPRLAAFAGKLYVAWCDDVSDGTSSNEYTWVFYSCFDGSSWTDPVQLPGPGTYKNPPCLVVFEDTLYALWMGAQYNGIYFASTTDGINWTPQSVLPGTQSTNTEYGGVSAAVYDGRLWVTWLVGKTSAQYAQATVEYDTSGSPSLSWSVPTDLPTVSTKSFPPALVEDPANNAMLLVWTDEDFKATSSASAQPSV